MTRYTDLVSKVVWWCFLGSPVLDHWLLQVQDHTPFSGCVPHVWGRWEGCSPGQWSDVWMDGLSILLSVSVPVAGLMALTFAILKPQFHNTLSTLSARWNSCDTAQLYQNKSWVTQLFNKSRIYPLQVGNKCLLKYLIKSFICRQRKTVKPNRSIASSSPTSHPDRSAG